jgi:transposase-like protein
VRARVAHRSQHDLPLSCSIIAPELEKRCRPHLNETNDSWRVDETHVKVKKVWMYLYCAVDSQGNTPEFLLSPRRDAEVAKRFISKALATPHSNTPPLIEFVRTLHKDILS